MVWQKCHTVMLGRRCSAWDHCQMQRVLITDGPSGSVNDLPGTALSIEESLLLFCAVRATRWCSVRRAGPFSHSRLSQWQVWTAEQMWSAVQAWVLQPHVCFEFFRDRMPEVPTDTRGPLKSMRRGCGALETIVCGGVWGHGVRHMFQQDACHGTAPPFVLGLPGYCCGGASWVCCTWNSRHRRGRRRQRAKRRAHPRRRGVDVRKGTPPAQLRGCLVQGLFWISSPPSPPFLREQIPCQNNTRSCSAIYGTVELGGSVFSPFFFEVTLCLILSLFAVLYFVLMACHIRFDCTFAQLCFLLHFYGITARV